jgi:hypothetical protein
MLTIVASTTIAAARADVGSPAERTAAGPEAVEVRINTSEGRRPISPYIYGKNHVDRDRALAREAGVRITRESSGNNCTKYNWRKDLSSHPDWFSNVYKQGWHERAQRLQDEFDDLQIMFCFQVLGWVAATEEHNYKEQRVPRDEWPERRSNQAGGGDPSLYLEPWTAKDTVDILDHWFGPGGLGLDPARFRYWHMDNEPACWPSTHDDVCPEDLTAEDVVQKYAAVAREVKSRYPEIRLMAPGFTSEWMWWNFKNEFVDGLPWMEYFIKRMAEESEAFGDQLIDVVDFHTYAGSDSDEDTLQLHRILYDPTYEYPKANGCKRYPDGGWHEDQNVEMIFGRTEQWLDQYFGPGHGIGIGVTEVSVSGPPMVCALWYASTLGTLADHGVEIHTPWAWKDCWWEVLHLFSRYGQPVRVASESSDEEMVSAYSSVSEDGGAMTVILVNRDGVRARRADVSVAGLDLAGTELTALVLSDLPEGERTFRSRTDNALESLPVEATTGGFSVELRPYSITAVLVRAR